MTDTAGAGSKVKIPAVRWLWVVMCLGIYLCMCLQQVVLTDRYFGTGLSLGSMAIRGVALGLSAWALWRHGVPVCLRRPLLAIAACIAALAASVLASEHTALAFRFAVRYGTMLLLLWGMLNFAVFCPDWPRTATLAALSALWLNLALGLAVLLQWPLALRISLAFHSEDAFKYLPRISGMHEHPALFASCAAVVALLVLQLYRRGELGRVALALALLGVVTAMALTQVRNIFLPIGVLLVWWAWSASGVHRRIACGGLLGLSMLAFFVLWQRYSDMTSATHENILTAVSLGRTYLWAGAWEAWSSHPWFGLGPGVFQYLVPDYTGGRFDRGELHAHNIILAMLSETGLCGLLAGIYLLCALWIPLLRSPDAYRWAVIWLMLLLGLSIFDHYLPFYAFSLHAILALSQQYAQAIENNHRRVDEIQ